MKDRHQPISNSIQHEAPHALFNLIPGAFFVIDLDGRIIDCNTSACEMFGYRKDEILLLHSRDLLAGGRNDHLPNIFIDAASSYVWLSCLRKNGLIFPVLYKNRIVTVKGQKLALFNVVDKAEISFEPQETAAHNRGPEENFRSLYMSWGKSGDDYFLLGYNKVAERYTQGKLADYIGEKASDLYRNQPDILKYFDLCVQQKNIFRCEVPYRMFSTGENKYMIMTYIFLEPNLVITCCDDITKRKEIESLFRESEKRRLLALEAASEGVWEWNIPTGTIVTCASYFSMLGFGLNDLARSGPEIMTSYEAFLELVHREDRDQVDHQLHRCITRRQAMIEMELRLKTKSGGWKWILKRGRVVDWDANGNPLRMIGTHIDINESRMAKDALQKSKERLRAQYMEHPLPTYTWQMVDNEMVLADYNAAAYQFTNGQLGDFIGKQACMLYQKNKEIFEAITKVFHDKTIHKGDTLYRMFTTGDKKYVTFTCAYVAPDMVLVYMEDITRQRLAEKKWQRSQKDLQKLTAQLIKADENVRQSIAQELHDSIGQYLTSIKYIAEQSVDQAPGGGPVRGDFSLQRLVPIIQTAIDEVSRIAMDLRPSTLDDLGIIATISWFFREYHAVYPSLALVKHIEIEEHDIPPAIKIHLFRIVQEALNNIARHSRATRVQVGLARTGGRVEIFIRDNGTGFDVQKNFRAGQNGRRGFGLFSMRERIKHSGGVFSIISMPQKGTTIRASWPCELTDISTPVPA